jgi:hypothetical protein
MDEFFDNFINIGSISIIAIGIFYVIYLAIQILVYNLS